jgi:nucleotide-binding universal stress UspA family protein
MGTRTERTLAVVAVDFLSSAPARTVEAACGLIRFAPHPEIHLLNVRHAPPGPTAPDEYGSSEVEVLGGIERELAALDDLGASVTAGTPVRAVSHARIGDEAREIVALAERLQADLIVLGRHERGGAKLLLHGPENVEADVRKAARCPVLVVEPETVTRHRDGARPASSPRGATRPPAR